MNQKLAALQSCSWAWLLKLSVSMLSCMPSMHAVLQVWAPRAFCGTWCSVPGLLDASSNWVAALLFQAGACLSLRWWCCNFLRHVISDLSIQAGGECFAPHLSFCLWKLSATSCLEIAGFVKQAIGAKHSSSAFGLGGPFGKISNFGFCVTSW